MAVVAFASANAAPKTNPYVDAEIDLSAVVLPQAAQLYGDAEDSSDPGNTSWDWSWTILDNDVAAPATLDSQVIQNPTLTVNVWRNVRLFLVVTNTNTSEVSETDPLQAPDSAFVIARVLSVNAGIQKFAAGERNWTGEVHAWADAIELDSGGAVPAHDLNDHTDVITATGPELEVLVSGAAAELPAGADLHTHRGEAVAVATISTPGVVILEEAPVGALTPKVITQERVILQGRAEVSRVALMGLVLGILPRAYPAADPIASGGPLIIWRIEEALKILGFAVILNDGGSAAAATPYRFALVRAASQAAVEALSWLTLSGLATPNGSPPTNNAPLILSTVAGTPPSVGAGEFLALLCLQAPLVSEGNQYGSGLSCQIYTRRAI